MLNKIKSVFFLRIDFSLLNDKRKLKLIKYNKSLQNKLNINLTHYKIFSGRFIVYENKRKENGLKKGKEYDSIKKLLIYNGKYLNGERNGKGEEYDFFGEVIFKGEYKKGKKWNGKLNSYELKDGKGYAKEYDKFYYAFEGEYLNGERNGKGKEYYYLERNNNDNIKIKFEGEYKNGKRWNGFGYDTNNNLVYELKNGKGYVKEYSYYYSDNWLFYEGEYLNGEKNGRGKEYLHNPAIGNFKIKIKVKYDGEYKSGLKHGHGKEYDLYCNLIFEGEYLYNHRKKGKAYINRKLEYEGEYYLKKKWNGKGYDENGKIIYELKDGTGFVKVYNCDLSIKIFEGNVIKGIKNGYGKDYHDFEGFLLYKENIKMEKEMEKEKNMIIMAF